MKTNTNKTNWKIALSRAGLRGPCRRGSEACKRGFGVGPELSPMAFQSADEAGDALFKAAKDGEEGTLAGILGAETKTLLSAGDKEAERAPVQSFASKYEQMNRWVDMNGGTRVLYVGADNYAFPVPLARNSSGRWYFDGVAGAEQIRARDIGRNELLTIDACSAIARAEEIYFASAGSPAEYAARIVSTSGQTGWFVLAFKRHSADQPAGNPRKPAEVFAGLEYVAGASGARRLHLPNPDCSR